MKYKGGRTSARGNRTAMLHNWAQIPREKIPRSRFNLDHGHQMTCDGGWLVPVKCYEVLPGDYFDYELFSLIRLTTPIVPFMDNVYVDFAAWFVPNRLVWSNWIHMMGEKDNPADPDYTAYQTPQIVTPNDGVGAVSQSLADYLGVCPGTPNRSVNSFLFRSYNLIWNKWYRSEQVQNSVTVDTGNGPDTYTNYTLLKRGKRKDYFTSCLPSPQMGVGVTLPLGTLAPVVGLGVATADSFQSGPLSVLETGGGSASYTKFQNGNAVKMNVTGAGVGSVSPLVYADLSSALSPTINSVRLAFQTQRLLERDARGGTRYQEMLLSHFGVEILDFRLQLPEFLGGSSHPIYLTPIAQTSATGIAGTTTPFGSLAAFAKGQGSVRFKKSFPEHGHIMILQEIRADLSYSQGLDKMFTRRTRFDYFMPVFNNLGEQPVYTQEIYDYDAANRLTVFGYQEHWAEYRYGKTTRAGLLRHNVTAGFATLDYWNLTEAFSAAPTLSSTFLQSSAKTVIDRVVAVTTQPQFVCDYWIKLNASRPMSTHGVPGLVDHM